VSRLVLGRHRARLDDAGEPSPPGGASARGAVAGRVARAAALLLLGLGGGCHEAGRAELRRYSVRAEIVQLPDPRSRNPELTVRHEAIDEFADASGAVVGMDAMVMPFGIGPSVSLAGLAVGDKVEVLIAVDWSRPAFGIERLRKLPEDTALHFGAARARRPRGP
jgi:Cu/Ag efflux protein CusF